MDPTLEIGSWSRNPHGAKKGRKHTNMHRLPSDKPNQQKGQVPATAYRPSTGPATISKVLHEARHQGCLSQHQDQRRRRMENSIQNPPRVIRISGHALWAMQRTQYIPTMDQRNPEPIHRQMLYSIFGRCPNILQRLGTTPKGRGKHPPSDKGIRSQAQTKQNANSTNKKWNISDSSSTERGSGPTPP